MLASHRGSPPWYFVLGFLLSTSRAITLSQFQRVSGFSQSCTDAYNTPLTGCTATDFINGNACSSGCIDFLKELTVNVKKACKDTIAPPDTLMAMLLSGEAVAQLCPNVPGGSEPLPGAAGEDGDETGSVVAGSTSCTPSVASLTPSAAKTSTPFATANINTEPILSRSVTATATSSVQAPLDSSATMTLTATESDSTPTIFPPESTIPLSVLTGSPSPSATALAESSSSGRNPEGGGGGTLFDLTSSSCRIATSTWWVGSIPAGVFVFAWLL